MIRRALLSVSDKTGLVPFARRLAARGVELVSTGGTAAALTEAGLAVIDVADVTGFPEMMDGRVKTLHPAIHGAILADLSNAEHRAAQEAHGIVPIGLVVCNLYPFEAALDEGRAGIELIDVGGPSVTRAATKNFQHVAVVVDPDDYGTVAGAIETGEVPLALRRRLAAKAFARLAAYDASVAGWLAAETAADEVAVDHRVWAAVGGRRIAAMRYGENPHQEAAFYRVAGGEGIATARIVQGKALSYNNVADADAAWTAAADFADGAGAAVVIVKHANPCGIAVRPTLADAYEVARLADPVSAFGGVVALSRPLDRDAAALISAIFTEVVIAPGASDDALELLAGKPNLRVLLAPRLPASSAMLRTVGGGFLWQDGDRGTLPGDAAVVTARAPTDAEWADLRFAWRAVKHVKSNAIVFAKDARTVGIGAGQMSRVDAARIAAWKAEDAARAAGEPHPRTLGAVAASDAFFPFADGLEAIALAGATAVIQPGGSVRDAEVIAAADRAGIAMVLTGMRHFRH